MYIVYAMMLGCAIKIILILGQYVYIYTPNVIIQGEIAHLPPSSPQLALPMWFSMYKSLFMLVVLCKWYSVLWIDRSLTML